MSKCIAVLGIKVRRENSSALVTTEMEPRNGGEVDNREHGKEIVGAEKMGQSRYGRQKSS